MATGSKLRVTPSLAAVVGLATLAVHLPVQAAAQTYPPSSIPADEVIWGKTDVALPGNVYVTRLTWRNFAGDQQDWAGYWSRADDGNGNLVAPDAQSYWCDSCSSLAFNYQNGKLYSMCWAHVGGSRQHTICEWDNDARHGKPTFNAEAAKQVAMGGDGNVPRLTIDPDTGLFYVLGYGTSHIVVFDPEALGLLDGGSVGTLDAADVRRVGTVSDCGYTGSNSHHPTSAAWDTAGHMWVCTLNGYCVECDSSSITASAGTLGVVASPTPGGPTQRWSSPHNAWGFTIQRSTGAAFSYDEGHGIPIYSAPSMAQIGTDQSSHSGWNFGANSAGLIVTSGMPAAGPCGNSGGDSDGDGVCNDDDVCDGGDDNIDTDEDGIPDDCDPCTPTGIKYITSLGVFATADIAQSASGVKVAILRGVTYYEVENDPELFECAAP